MIRIVGDTFCDIIASSMEGLPKVGGDVLANISLVAGGSGLNSTVHGANFCSVMGIPVQFELVTAIGADFQGEVCLAALRHELINLILAREHGLRTGSCIVLSSKSERSFVSDRGCVGPMSLEWFGDKIRQFDGISHVHAAGYFNCSQLMKEMPRYFEEVLNQGLTTSLNPQYDATECWIGIEDISPFLTLLVCNELELIACANPKDRETKQPVLERVETTTDAAKRVLGWGCRCVVVTRGPDGASVFTRKGSSSEILEESEPAVALKDGVVDSTGAGDSFCGAYLAQWVHSGRANRASLQSGLLAGAACVSVDGGSTKPSADILRRLQVMQSQA